MSSPLGRAVDAAGRFRVTPVDPRVEMDVPGTNAFSDLPIKPLSATKSTHLTVVIQYIEGCKYPMPKLQAVAEHYKNGDYIKVGPQRGLHAKLEDIQSFQLLCLPREHHYDVVKMIRFKPRTSVKAILSALRSDTFMVDVAVVSGRNKVPVVLQHLFTGLGGNQELDCTLTATSIKKSNKPSASQQTLQDGFLFIKDNGPRSNNQNQMTEWCEMQIVEGSGSVIEGWSRDLVMSSLKNYASGSMASTSLMEYPVTLRDVRRWVLDEVVVPFLKVAPEHGLILQGQTGIGKTPLARGLAMSISQHYITEEGLEAEPSIRSCAVLDMLRTEGGQKHKPIVYDDGPLDTNKASDVKGLMDVQEEEVLLWARWGSIKLVKAQHRCIITNPLGDKPDAGALERTISHEAFQQLVSPAFVMGMPEQDFLAICKRAFHVVFLKDRCYIRHPCESKVPVKQYMYPGGIADLIKDESKATLGAYKRGEQPDQPRLDANRRWSEVLVRKGIAGENLEEFIDANRGQRRHCGRTTISRT